MKDLTAVHSLQSISHKRHSLVAWLRKGSSVCMSVCVCVNMCEYAGKVVIIFAVIIRAMMESHTL